MIKTVKWGVDINENNHVYCTWINKGNIRHDEAYATSVESPAFQAVIGHDVLEHLLDHESGIITYRSEISAIGAMAFVRKNLNVDYRYEFEFLDGRILKRMKKPPKDWTPSPIVFDFFYEDTLKENHFSPMPRYEAFRIISYWFQYGYDKASQEWEDDWIAANNVFELVGKATKEAIQDLDYYPNQIDFELVYDTDTYELVSFESKVKYKDIPYDDE